MSELSIVVGVSTVLGLAALAMYLFYKLERSRLEHAAEDSIAEDLEGPAKLKAADILKVILSFKDEDRRLRAIEALTKYDERKTRIFAKSAEQKAPVARLIKERENDDQSQNRMKLAGSAFAVFLVVGVVAQLGERYIETASRPTPPDRQTLEFKSGPQNSGSGSAFSGQYEVCSQAIPTGYRIESDTFRLVGDRACNAYSTCEKTLSLPARVCWSFSLQGHNEFGDGGVRQSEGILTVVIVRP